MESKAALHVTGGRIININGYLGSNIHGLNGILCRKAGMIGLRIIEVGYHHVAVG